jgi:hypothetical protein
MGLVHGEWCGTRTWPTHCSVCGGEVFFFTCEHGSKVFFDELGHPWTIHDCETSWTRNLNRTISGDGEMVVELRPGIFAIRSSDGPDSFAIEQSVVSKARAIKKEQKQDPIVAINPERALSESHIGTLRKLRHSVDPVKVYKVKATSMGRAMLGPIGAQDVGRITVHVPYPSDDQIESFTTWIPTKLLGAQRIMNGVTVAFDLETVNVPGYGYTWFCERLEVLG